MGQTISNPNVVARMIGALGIGKRLKVLEIGTGSGYQTAILSHLYRRVYSIERHASLLADAEVAKRQSQRDWQTIGWAGVGLPEDVGTERCIPSAIDYLNGLDEDDSHIFADQRIEHITLVGIVRLPALPNTESGQNRLRAVFLVAEANCWRQK